MAVGSALRLHGIRAILTGGACASVHCGGRYTSADVDLVLEGRVGQSTLDEAMASVGFARRKDHYASATSVFIVEFPRGPLAIGQDHRLRPVLLRRREGTTLALSATDSCRDRLAAFYFWTDREALRVAVQIALRNRVGMGIIREWSEREGMLDRYAEFVKTLTSARRARRRIVAVSSRGSTPA